MSDDVIAKPESTAALSSLYSRAIVDIQAVSPREIGADSIGHAGFFRPRFRESLWSRPLDWLDARLADAGH
jgi:predicted alpha/beta hydrolase